MSGRISLALRSASILALSASVPLNLATEAKAQDSVGVAQKQPVQNAKTGIPEWSIESADFAPDPDVVFGALPNGMRYALQRNVTPPGEAAIRFNVEVGSREETAAENGAAHFVEHMAFNGSTKHPRRRPASDPRAAGPGFRGRHQCRNVAGLHDLQARSSEP